MRPSAASYSVCRSASVSRCSGLAEPAGPRRPRAAARSRAAAAAGAPWSRRRSPRCAGAWCSAAARPCARPAPRRPPGTASAPSRVSSAVGSARVPSLSFSRSTRMPLSAAVRPALLEEEEREAGAALGRALHAGQGQRGLAGDGGGEPLRAPQRVAARLVAPGHGARAAHVAAARALRHPLAAGPELGRVAGGEVGHARARPAPGRAPAACARRRRSWPAGSWRWRSWARRGRAARPGGAARRGPGPARRAPRTGPSGRPRPAARRQAGAASRRGRRAGPRRRTARDSGGFASASRARSMSGPAACLAQLAPLRAEPGRARRPAAGARAAPRSAGSSSNVLPRRGGSCRNSSPVGISASGRS